MKAILTSKPHQSGWSLIELVLGVTILGILGVGAWLALAPGNRVQDQASSEHVALTRSRHALLGYALVNHRLPYADQSSARQGTESFDATQGRLPVRTLGLPYELQIDYAVDPTLVEAPRIRFSPAVSNNNAPPPPRTIPNGFDLCSALITVQRAETLKAENVALAYALLRRRALTDGTPPGPGDITQLPGNHNGPRSEHIAIGAAELIQTLRCPRRMTKAAALAVQAQAAEEIPRLAGEYRAYRDMRYRAATASEFGAQVEVLMDSAWITLQTSNIILGYKKAMAVSSKLPVDTGLAWTSVALSATVLGRQIKGLILDSESLAKAPGDTASAANSLRIAYQWEARVQNYANQAIQLATKELQRGLLP